jgi:glycosidase
MQWSDETSAGFSSNQDTWLPVQENYKSINVESQLADHNSLLNTYRDLLKLRAESSLLREGKIDFIEPASLPEDVLAYTRTLGDNKLTIYLNFSDEPKTINLEQNGSIIKYAKRASIAEDELKLEGFGVLILQL